MKDFMKIVSILEYIKAMEFHHFFRGVRLNSTWIIYRTVNLLPCFIHSLNDFIFYLLINNVFISFDFFNSIFNESFIKFRIQKLHHF